MMLTTQSPSPQQETPHQQEASPAAGRMYVTGPLESGFDSVLTPEALAFLAALHTQLLDERRTLLTEREFRSAAFLRGEFPAYPEETRAIREDTSWHAIGHRGAKGLSRRRVEITGAPDGRTAANALNSDADSWLADFEDAMSPTWANVVTGQANLMEAVRGRLRHVTRVGKLYEQRNPNPPTIVVRPRGLHLPEAHLRYTDAQGAETQASASIVDFGLYFFHNARALAEAGGGAYYCIPKMESAAEARWWNRMFVISQGLLGLPVGTIRATALIETLGAAIEMEEIVWELRDHCAGLHAGRWDYIFSMIKAFRHDPTFLLPDRKVLTMDLPFLRAYTQRIVDVCHRRNIHALGGMATAFPDREDPEKTAEAQLRVREDKEHEAAQGFDGTWVAHPSLIPVARAAFEEVLGDDDSQIDWVPPTSGSGENGAITAADLLSREGLPTTEDLSKRVSEEGVRTNIRAGLAYLNAWLSGQGALKVDHLVEDVSSVEISRAQIWQWIRRGVQLEGGRVLTGLLVDRWLAEELAITERSPIDHYTDAAELFRAGAMGEELPESFTVHAYDRHLVDRRARAFGSYPGAVR
ncbi:malate synthase [Brevibacterium album]|uniref:malate synthase n=1 Tax=Brevibacterium album TaxID=417948 RepID=UPI00041F6B6D|nr:malate synthase [Brevibacterium album]